MQRIMRVRNHHQHKKVHYLPPSSEYEMRGGLSSSSSCSPPLTSHLTCPMESSWRPSPNVKGSNGVAYALPSETRRADPTHLGCAHKPGHWRRERRCRYRNDRVSAISRAWQVASKSPHPTTRACRLPPTRTSTAATTPTMLPPAAKEKPKSETDK